MLEREFIFIFVSNLNDDQTTFFEREKREIINMVSLLVQTAAFTLNIIGGLIMLIAVFLPNWKELDVQVSTDRSGCSRLFISLGVFLIYKEI